MLLQMEIKEALKRFEGKISVGYLAHKLDVSPATIERWRDKKFEPNDGYKQMLNNIFRGLENSEKRKDDSN